MEAKLFFFLSLVACFSLSISGNVNTFESVPDLEKSMYTQIDGYPCVRLLNISGEIGCSNPGREKVVAPIVRFKNTDKLVESAAVLVSVDEFESLLSRLSKDPDYARKVAGVLVESRTQIPNGLNGNSPDVKFPQAEFAPYKRNDFEWNPQGSGIMWKDYNFPVFLLSETSTTAFEKAVVMDEKMKTSYVESVAEFDLVMQTTKSGNHDSESCLKEGTCLPLGGYSVWSTLPPANISSPPKPLILAMTSMDSASFFRDKSPGADSPISGLITLLAAVEALSGLDGLDNRFNKQLVFLVFTGEAWGYIGSRRFLLESDQQSYATKGLDLNMIDVVMEIGSIGKSSSEGMKTLYAHTAGATTSLGMALDALKHAQNSLISENIVVKTASSTNPGIPPSSLMSFLKKKPETTGLVLEDFDSAFTNKFYHSHLDDLPNINTSAIISAASLVARTLYVLASGDKSSVNTIKVNASVVEELASCLLNCEPGLSCDLVKRYISPSAACPSNYVGVISGDPSSTSYVGDISRFVWNFLAEKTSMPSNSASSCPKDCNGVGELCVGEETDGKGVCVISTTRYVPAYSTRLKYESESWTLLPINSSDPMSRDDPVWTESNWDTTNLRLYTVQHASYDRLILFLGIIVTVLAYIFIVIARTFIRKALKQE